MRIDSTRKLTRAEASPAPRPPQKPTTEPDKVDMAKTDALNKALQTTPDVRTKQVARAKALVQDPDYPPAKVVDQVANILTSNIRSQE